MGKYSVIGETQNWDFRVSFELLVSRQLLIHDSRFLLYKDVFGLRMAGGPIWESGWIEGSSFLGYWRPQLTEGSNIIGDSRRAVDLAVADICIHR